MSFRLTAAAPAIRSLLARPPIASSRQFVRKMAQNSTSHTHTKGSSDLPWIIGAVAFTVPSSLYLLSGSSKPPHHPPAGHGNAAKEDISKTASNAAGKAREKASEAYSEAKEKAPTSAAEAKDAAVAAKEKSSEKAKDLKDEAKEKISDKAKDLKDGAEEKAGEYSSSSSKESSDKDKGAESKKVKGKPSDIDEPKAAAKESAGQGTQSGKQEGLSNADTNHAVLNDERGQAISKKSEGTHDTAKLKGTVDPSRDPK